MSEHTPTPWEVHNYLVAAQIDGDIEVICYTGNNKKSRTPEARANAALIARAVNAHNGLLEILEAVVKAWVREAGMGGRHHGGTRADSGPRPSDYRSPEGVTMPATNAELIAALEACFAAEKHFWSCLQCGADLRGNVWHCDEHRRLKTIAHQLTRNCLEKKETDRVGES